MKKLLTIAAIAGIMVACKNGEKKTETTDSAATTAPVAPTTTPSTTEVAPTTEPAQNNQMDSAAAVAPTQPADVKAEQPATDKKSEEATKK